MTQDELLDKISHWNYIEPEPLLHALSWIVRLHEPKDGDCSHCFANASFDAYPVQYPCPTIEIIQEVLK